MEDGSGLVTAALCEKQTNICESAERESMKRERAKRKYAVRAERKYAERTETKYAER